MLWQSLHFVSKLFQAMNYNKLYYIVLMIFLFVGDYAVVDCLKCHMCGQYNEGVGSITPCFNYSKQHEHLYLKECSKKSEKYCVKYVSELSTVRDCATECVEKEIWETQTYCCTEDGCNGTDTLQSFYQMPVVLSFIIYMYIHIIDRN